MSGSGHFICVVAQHMVIYLEIEEKAISTIGVDQLPHYGWARGTEIASILPYRHDSPIDFIRLGGRKSKEVGVLKMVPIHGLFYILFQTHVAAQ